MKLLLCCDGRNLLAPEGLCWCGLLCCYTAPPYLPYLNAMPLTTKHLGRKYLPRVPTRVDFGLDTQVKISSISTAIVDDTSIILLVSIIL